MNLNLTVLAKLADATVMVFSPNVKGVALEKLSQAVNIPIIASGGAGKVEHFCDVFKSGNIDAALAASVFHFNEIGLGDLKIELKKNNIPIRL